MGETATVEATIARLRAKRDAATDKDSRRYYELCIAGWQRHLDKLRKEKQQWSITR